jgi:hypothetical protein
MVMIPVEFTKGVALIIIERSILWSERDAVSDYSNIGSEDLCPVQNTP